MFSLHTSYSTLCILAVGMSGIAPPKLLGPERTGPNPNGIGGGGGGGGGIMVHIDVIESCTNAVVPAGFIRILMLSSIVTASTSRTPVSVHVAKSSVVTISLINDVVINRKGS